MLFDLIIGKSTIDSIKKRMIKKPIKKWKYDRNIWKIITKNNKYDENHYKMSQKREIYKTWKFAAYKNIFSGFLNWVLGDLQSSDDENKIAIRGISIRAIQKLSYRDQQTIVDGPNFNLTNCKFSSVFSPYFVHSTFAKKTLFCYNFDWFPNYFDQILYFFIDSNQ